MWNPSCVFYYNSFTFLVPVYFFVIPWSEQFNFNFNEASVIIYSCVFTSWFVWQNEEATESTGFSLRLVLVSLSHTRWNISLFYAVYLCKNDSLCSHEVFSRLCELQKVFDSVFYPSVLRVRTRGYDWPKTIVTEKLLKFSQLIFFWFYNITFIENFSYFFIRFEQKVRSIHQNSQQILLNWFKNMFTEKKYTSHTVWENNNWGPI